MNITTGNLRSSVVLSPFRLLAPIWRERRHFGAADKRGRVVGDIGITRGDLYATVAGTWWRDAGESSRLTVVRRVVPIAPREELVLAGSDAPARRLRRVR